MNPAVHPGTATTLTAESEPTLFQAIAREVGAQGLEAGRSAYGLYSLLLRTIYFTAEGKRDPKAVWQQMYEIGNKSVFFLTVTMGAIGMILVYQAGTQAARIIPDYTQIGRILLQLGVRDVAPTLAAIMLAARVGAGIAAEIGSMVVTEQVDALRMCAADPVDFLVVPRFIASVVMTLALAIWGGVVCFSAGAVVANVAFDVSPGAFFDFGMVRGGDVITGIVKALAYGAAIPIVSGYCGLTTFGGSEGVGSATTRAVVNSSLAIILLNLVISVAAFIIFP